MTVAEFHVWDSSGVTAAAEDSAHVTMSVVGTAASSTWYPPPTSPSVWISELVLAAWASPSGFLAVPAILWAAQYPFLNIPLLLKSTRVILCNLQCGTLTVIGQNPGGPVRSFQYYLQAAGNHFQFLRALCQWQKCSKKIKLSAACSMNWRKTSLEEERPGRQLLHLYGWEEAQ